MTFRGHKHQAVAYTIKVLIPERSHRQRLYYCRPLNRELIYDLLSSGISMIMSDHKVIASPLKCGFSYSCTTINKISNGIARSLVSLR